MSFTGRVVSPPPNPQAGGPPTVGCPLLLIQYIRSYPPYLEAISSIRNPRTWHAVVTVDPLNMVHKLTVDNIQCHHLHTKISSKSTNRFKSCTHLRSFNGYHFGMPEATRLENWRRDQLAWQYLSTKFHENPQIGSKVISGGHTERQAGDFINPLSFFQNRLKISIASSKLRSYMSGSHFQMVLREATSCTEVNTDWG
jgi:5-methylcytosine-specific restriction endonuclease McrA